MLVKNTNPAFINVELSPENVQAITTTRQLSSGVAGSAAPFDQFNLGDHVGDHQEQVARNRDYLKQLLPSKVEIQWLNQVHGADVALIEAYSPDATTADAAFTKEKNIALAIMTADCLPILLTSKCGEEIAAIHGGWRPLAADIIENTLAHFSCSPSEIQAWLGPCIGAEAFEVGCEVRDKFSKQDAEFADYFTACGEKYYGNLQAIARHQLVSHGVKTISALPECTYSTPNKYFSYRREGKTGRMASLVLRQK